MKRYIEKIIKVAGIGIIVFIGWAEHGDCFIRKNKPKQS